MPWRPTASARRLRGASLAVGIVAFAGLGTLVAGRAPAASSEPAATVRPAVVAIAPSLSLSLRPVVVEPSIRPSPPTDAPSGETPRPIEPTPSSAPTSPATAGARMRAPATAPGAGIASGPTWRVATRVVVPALGIDLPVIRQRHSYPECNVAMYLPTLHQPGQGAATYLYAHARTGMFLPLLQRSLVKDGASMLGMPVLVYTGDSRLFAYRISAVHRHATSLAGPLSARGEELWLQTSEGPHGTIPKLQVEAKPVSSGRASFAAAHPKPHPIVCG